VGEDGSVQVQATVPAKQAGAAIERGAGRENIINKYVA
jgi:hypothetical protein